MQVASTVSAFILASAVRPASGYCVLLNCGEFSLRLNGPDRSNTRVLMLECKCAHCETELYSPDPFSAASQPANETQLFCF